MNSINLASDRKVQTSEKVTSPFVSMTPFHRVLIVGVLVAYLVWIGAQELPNSSSNAEAGLIFLALTLNFVLLLVPVIFYQPSYGWFHPLVFNIFVTLIYHFRRSEIYTNGLQWHLALPGWSPDNLNHLVVYELLLRALGLLACYLGFWLSPTWGTPKIAFQFPRQLMPKVLLAVTFSTMVFLAYMQTQGGLVSHILSWGRGRRLELAGDSYWLFFIQFGLIACLFWLAMDRKVHLNPVFWGAAGISILCNFFGSGSRSTIVYFMAMGLLVWLLREQKISVVRVAAVMLVGLLILGILGNFRASTFSGEVDWTALTGASSGDESALTTGLTEVTERSGVVDGVFPILALVPDEVDYLRGSSYLAVLTLPIPRGLWPEKPGLLGGRVGETFFNTTAGMPAGVIGEAYWNFGIVGVPLVYFLFGFFYRWLTESFRKYAHEAAATVLYVVTLFQFSGPSGDAVVAWLITFVPFLIFLYLIGAIAFRPRKQGRSQVV